VPRVLAVDVGTSSARAQLFEDGALPVGPSLGRQHHEPDANGELDPEPIVQFAERALGAAGAVDAVAWSCLWHSLLALDERGRPLTPVSTWLDARAAPDTLTLAAELDADAVHTRTGAPLHSSFWPAKLRRLLREGTAFTHVASLPDYLRLRVTGTLSTTVSIASGTGLFDVHGMRWDRELLDALGLEEAQLPPLSEDDVVLGDGGAANVGAGCLTRERACLTIGTSGALRVVRDDDASVRSGLFLYRLDESRFVQGGAVSDGGNLLAWLEDTLHVQVLDAVDRPPGRVTFLPLVGGERSPGWRADATGVIAGLSQDVTADDVVQAAFEGIAYRFAEILDLLPEVMEIVGTGGALRSRPRWAQLLADVLERPLTLSAVDEPSARGAAAVALERLGGDVAPAPLGRRFEPRPERAAIHREARGRQRVLYATAPGT
jgi:gluconokinase